MSEAVRRLDALVARWRVVAGSAATARLNPPASEAELAELARDVALPLPAELRALWLWHNGQDADLIPEGYLLGGFWLNSVADSLRDRRMQAEIGMEVDGIEFFNESWIPFASVGNTTVALDARTGVVRASGEYEPGGTLASFEAWVGVCERAFEADVWNRDIDDAELDRRRALFTRDEQDFI